MTSTLTAHQIPYTPFTAFVPKQNASKMSDSVADVPRAHLLDETDDPLARLYNQLLRFIERDVCKIMDLAEKVTVKPTADARLEKAGDLSPIVNDTSSRDDDRRGFQIMAQVVWDEMGRSIMDEIGGIVFAAGRPNEFRKVSNSRGASLKPLNKVVLTALRNNSSLHSLLGTSSTFQTVSRSHAPSPSIRFI